METNFQIDEQILKTDKVICRHIDNLNNLSRGQISQDILSQLRHFVEHIMLKIYANGNDIEDSHENLQKAVQYAKNESSLRHLSRFHHFLQVSVSHRTLEEENSERLMLKYYEYLLRLKNFLHNEYSLDVLSNLEQFPLETDNSFKEYYEKIAQEVDQYRTPIHNNFQFDRFYIQKIKSFFINNKIYYEVAFIPANDRASKTDRIIAFTDIEITDFYAVKFALANTYIDLFGRQMPIRIIVDWEVSIRPCEFKNFIKLFNKNGFTPGNAEQRNLTKYLTETGLNLSEVIMFSDENYQKVRELIVPQTNTRYFFDILDKCRLLIQKRASGSNILCYLLYHMTNRIIKDQYEEQWKWDYDEQKYKYVGENNLLSNLYLSNKCIPFDTMPFCSALKGHIPSLLDLVDCLDKNGHEYEFLAWTVKNNTEQKGMLFTPLERKEDGNYKLGFFNDINTLVNIYNSMLHNNHRQQSRKLIIRNDHIFIESYKEDTISIIQIIKGLAMSGINNYSNVVNHWLQNSNYQIDSDEKRTVLLNMFTESRVSVIYGSAGTGKTTLINHVSHLFNNYSRLYLAHTNPAVNNLRRKVVASSKCEFMTITKFINARDLKRDYDILVIDECSTVSNKNMRKLLEVAEFKLLVLVGDTYQIEAIEFGNWFDVVRNFLPKSAVCELTKPYRSDSRQLLELWDNVRKMGDDVFDRLQGGEFSENLTPSIFTPARDNEIILCLSYGGLYGINNINHFMQESNNGKEIWRGIQRYKVGDPILFNDSADKFFVQNNDQVPIIHNNMKARIVDFTVLDIDRPTERIQFDIEIDRPLIDLNVDDYDFEIIGNAENGNSVIRFAVNKNRSTDEDDDGISKVIVPFQIAYAVSIHKAQGLEYDSVKIIITDEIDELITHNIFYTAITRAKKKLKIYWTQTVEKKILDRIKPKNSRHDISLLKREIIDIDNKTD
ncbi:MAG: ATP-dependent RecD-like DNA helicase [Ruminococcus flavefaciens]|nr:ATP-dependent RecD-like DNA helicase [Ruminococcus flavefaciens]